MEKYHGILATTHVDKHNECISKEALENMADQINSQGKIQWLTWNHQTTLPPIGYVDKAWVEQLEDGEYGLFFEATALIDHKDLVIVKDIEISKDDLDRTQLEIAGLQLSYDPRNFGAQEIEAVVDKLSSQYPIQHQLYVRKAEFPPSVLWLVVGFIAGGVATGFLNRIGEVVADKVMEVTGKKLKNIGEILASLEKKTLTKDRPDYVFIIPIEDSDVNVEGALECPDAPTLIQACEKLPELYIYAKKLLSQNREGYFSDLKFLFNPMTALWEINFLTIRSTHQVVLGKRYFIPDHPLHLRFEEQLREIKDIGNKRPE
jgi:hypothetical protein